MVGGAVNTALDELEHVHAFLFARVGNRADAEDLTQQVALKALPRLREGAPAPAIRSYLFATARSVLGAFWSSRLRLPEAELGDDLPGSLDSTSSEPSAQASAWLAQTLAALPPPYRQVLELRFLRGASIREVARETGRTPGAVKVMQLRALRAAATLEAPSSPSRSRPGRPSRAAAPGSAFAPQHAIPTGGGPPR